MLVTFTTDAHESITMFGDVAQRLIKMMGQSGQVPSAILKQDVAAALQSLLKAIEQEKQSPNSSENDDEEEDEISIEHRAYPLINLLQAAIKNQCNVMWH